MNVTKLRELLNTHGTLKKASAAAYIAKYVTVDTSDDAFCCALMSAQRPLIYDMASVFDSYEVPFDERVSLYDEFSAFDWMLRLWDKEGAKLSRKQAGAVADRLHKGGSNGMTIMVVVGGSGASKDDKLLNKFMDTCAENTMRIRLLSTFRSHHRGNYPLYLYGIYPRTRKKVAAGATR